MPVFPHRRQAITSDRFYVYQRGFFGRETLFVLQHARLPAFARTPGTGTGPTQRLPTVNAFVFIAPGENESPVFFIAQKRYRYGMIILGHDGPLLYPYPVCWFHKFPQKARTEFALVQIILLYVVLIAMSI